MPSHGRDGIENWTFYLVYNLFRSGAIIQGVYKRGLDGNAASAQALEYKDACRSRAELGLWWVRRAKRFVPFVRQKKAPSAGCGAFPLR